MRALAPADPEVRGFSVDRLRAALSQGKLTPERLRPVLDRAEALGIDEELIQDLKTEYQRLVREMPNAHRIDKEGVVSVVHMSGSRTSSRGQLNLNKTTTLPDLTEATESRVGIHVIPNFGVQPTVYSQEITEAAVRSALKSVDWMASVVVVLSPGTSMEVRGSLLGLSAIYRNRHKGIKAVTRDAPKTVRDLEVILLAFIKPGDGWMQVQKFDFFLHGGR